MRAPRPGSLETLLHLPAFILAALTMFWASTLAGLLGYVQFWRLRGRRNDTYAAVRFLADFHRVKAVHVGRGVLYRAGPVMYLANHRSWADFFLDLLFLEGRPCTLSRLGVLLLFPVTMLSGVALRSVILFHRGPIADKKRFNSWLDRKLQETSYQGLLVYPEGHRSTAGQSLPLKRGMLHYAYERKMPIQIVVSCNKDAVIAEKQLTARFGQTVGVSYSDLIDTSAFASFEGFLREVQAAWDRQWALTDTADLAGLPPLEQFR
ncbi:EF hand [Micractinium conductrix]|uniref:EF hand n=1 Tax=Micractinium conductrix TaxID=554055 RepID=A0A2P6V9C0_9CHLO|nr:EF hand [Micractinium conductrix]|eukprot:PSC70674.1 EF hand [Micractinium conductrix]